MLTFRDQEQFVIDFGLTDIVRDWRTMTMKTLNRSASTR